jgi:putative membrane protein
VNQQFTRFLIRWAVNGFGLWLSGELISEIRIEGKLGTILIAGLVLSLVNALIRPLIIILTLPAVLLSLGLFMIVINGFAVWLAGAFYDTLVIDSFGAAVLAGLIIGLLNYALSVLVEER